MPIPTIPTGLGGGPPTAGGGGPPGGMSIIPPDALVRQKQGQAITIWGIGAFCIFGWELLLCLPKEYRTIWRRPMNASSVLYLLNRYFGALQLCFVVSLNANAWSSSACRHVYYFEPVGALISTVLSQMILGSRVYAVYFQSKIIASTLILTLTIEIVIGGISISTTRTRLPTVLGTPSGVPTCGAITGPFGWLVAFWIIPLFYDTLAFFLTAWKAYDFWRKDVNTRVFEVIWRDGLLYFFAIFSMNAVNVVVFGTVPKTLQPVNLTPTLVLEIVLSCRLVLNLRTHTYHHTSTSTTSGSSRSHPKWNDSTKVNGSGGVQPGKDYKSYSSPPNSGVHVSRSRRVDSEVNWQPRGGLGGPGVGGVGGKGELEGDWDSWDGKVINLEPLRRAYVVGDEGERDRELSKKAVWNMP